VIHRGNNRSDVFVDDRDRRRFLRLLAVTSKRNGVAIHGYTLMQTHFHLQVTAPDEDALPRMMQALGRRYVLYFNKRHQRTGTLWEGRYRSPLIADERYWLTCLRYIELNPVRAGIVTAPTDYQWSSARAHARGEANRLLTSHVLYDQLAPDASTRAAKWSDICRCPLSEADLGLIRTSVRRGLALRTPSKGGRVTQAARPSATASPSAA
jgi:putative transposase